jgi:hypothetical protein
VLCHVGRHDNAQQVGSVSDISSHSPLEGTGFELLVRGRCEGWLSRPFDARGCSRRVGRRPSDPATAEREPPGKRPIAGSASSLSPLHREACGTESMRSSAPPGWGKAVKRLVDRAPSEAAERACCTGRGRRAERCRHANPVVPEDRQPDRTDPSDVIGRASDCTPASAPTNRRRKADRLETLMRVFAVRRLAYRAGL